MKGKIIIEFDDEGSQMSFEGKDINKEWIIKALAHHLELMRRTYIIDLREKKIK